MIDILCGMYVCRSFFECYFCRFFVFYFEVCWIGICCFCGVWIFFSSFLMVFMRIVIVIVLSFFFFRRDFLEIDIWYCMEGRNVVRRDWMVKDVKIGEIIVIVIRLLVFLLFFV